MKKLSVVLLALFCHNVNAEWGQQWGSMVWGQSSTNVPMMGDMGQLIFFGLLLVIGVFVTKRWGLIKTLPAIAMLSLMPLMVDADEIELNTFQNGQVADADEVNENFNNLKTAIENNNGIGNLITRQASIQIDGDSGCINEECFSDWSFDGFSACLSNEVALTGGCRLQRNSVSVFINTKVNSQSSYTENNRHYCAGHLDFNTEQEPNPYEFTITAYVSCLSQ